MRQLIRWHCRLNHVAAHTTMLTVFVDEFLARPTFTLQKIASFVDISLNTDQITSLLLSHYHNNNNNLIKVPHRLTQRGQQVLEEELSNTNNLSQWPCRNFLSLESSSSSSSLILPTLRYYDLAADCTAPYVKCTIRFDKREQQQSSN